MRDDTFFCAGEKGKKGGAIVSCEVNAVIKLFARDGKKHCHVPQIAPRHKSPIDACDGRQQVRAFAGNNKCNARLRKFVPQRRDGWRRQNQIADPFELKKQNFHAKIAPIKVAQASGLWPQAPRQPEAYVTLRIATS
jgi:hypothetical protein